MTWLHMQIPDQLHRQLKREAFERNVTLKELVTELLTDAAAREDVCSCGHSRLRHQLPTGGLGICQAGRGLGSCDCERFNGVDS